MNEETIFAPASAPGKAGVAVLRISGAHAAKVFPFFALPVPAPRVAKLVKLAHPETKELIDHALALYFSAPASFTGEDVVELHLHGSPAVMREMLSLLGILPGFRLAQPGEFSRRAFLSGKMDLTQAEGIADLIDAETSAQARQALRQMEGETGRFFDQLRMKTIRTLALLEAYIDFPEEEIPESTLAEVSETITSLSQTIEQELGDTRGEKIREGFEIAIIGAPNAGKSSLLNYLAKRDAAIVSDIAGTTRDVVEVHLNLGGYAVTIADTAGLRETSDLVEKEGVARAQKRAKNADMVLALFDASTLPLLDPETLAHFSDKGLAIISKADLIPALPSLPMKAYALSIRSGQGTSEFLELLTDIIGQFFTRSAPHITRARHRAHLQSAVHHLQRALPSLPLELQCEELRLAANEIGELTGKIAVDELLDVVFREFCIGK